jgi:hypothetical protein
MFSLNYTVGLSSSTCLVPSEEYANEFLDLVAKTRVIDTVTLTELPNYKPSKRVVFATTRSWE